MSDFHTQNLSQSIQRIQLLINRKEVIEAWLHSQNKQPKHSLVESLTHRQHLTELGQLINRLHPADTALLLESIPPEQRPLIWHLIDEEKAGAVLLELSDSVKHELINHSDSNRRSPASRK